MTTQDLEKLTPEEKRILIAGKCGYHDIRPYRANHPYARPTFIGLNPDVKDWHEVPDYLNSLDACNKMENALDESQRFQFRNALVKPTKYALDDEWDRMHSTALQRADAFLLTVG